MEYKKITIEDINETLGFDVTSESKDMAVVRARQGAWLCFYINGHSYAEIGRMFNRSRRTVTDGVDTFEDKLKEGDKLTLEIWEKLKKYEIWR